MSYLDNAVPTTYAETEPIEIPATSQMPRAYSPSIQASDVNSEIVTTSTRLIDSSNSSIDRYGSDWQTPQDMSHTGNNTFLEGQGSTSSVKHNATAMSSSYGDSNFSSPSGNILRHGRLASADRADPAAEVVIGNLPGASQAVDDSYRKDASGMKNETGTSEESTPLGSPENGPAHLKVHVPFHMDIATFPTDQLVDMLTGLLTKIIKSNDSLGAASPRVDTTQGNNLPLIREILSFRGKQVPGITLKQYFQRIQKYCPTTNDVLLSLLVHFDRIAKKCNAIVQQHVVPNSQSETQPQGRAHQIFVMDSYNIHRLIIAAITVSTKFISDFFYSNSRYARVGGISLQELNHLELQFLVLCDFRLIISVEELQRYADLLYKFWEKEMKGSPPAQLLSA